MNEASPQRYRGRSDLRSRLPCPGGAAQPLLAGVLAPAEVFARSFPAAVPLANKICLELSWKVMSDDAAESARDAVERFLEASMIAIRSRRDTGGRLVRGGREHRLQCERQAWVGKRFEGTDVVTGATAAKASGDGSGTLCAGDRYVDRVIAQAGETTCMDESAEILLTRAGLAEDLRQVAASRAARDAA
jgi:hypothetical protein